MLRIVFMGTPQFAVPSLKTLITAGYKPVAVVTQPDRPQGRGKKVRYSPVKEEALRQGIEIHQPERVRESGFIQKLKSIAPDLVVVVAFGQILPPEILRIPPLGCLNLHASLLPAYRGAAPIQWALIQGEKTTGVTTMLMDEGMDTGDLLLSAEVEIGPRTTGGELQEQLAQKGAELLLRTIPLLVEGKIKPVPQRHLPATYAPLLKREDEQIKWQEPAKRISGLVRALSPEPGAFTLYRGSPLKIREALLHTGEDSGAPPGTVIDLVKGQGFVIQTGKGSLLVTQVQPGGKKTMPAPSFINGYHLERGFVFQ